MPAVSLKFAEGTFQDNNGVVSCSINLEGEAEGFGAVFATARFFGVGQSAGDYEILAVSYPESGDQVIGRGSGEWTRIAPNQWNTVGTMELSTGGTLKGESILDLATRTWSGTFN